MGYRAFKIHPFAWTDVRTHVDAVLAIGDRGGGRMDMMLDSYCFYDTFADALKVGLACDEAGFFWNEDPYSEGGLTGTMKLAHAAESIGIDIAPHGSGPAQLHFMAAVKNSNYYEVAWVHPNVPSFNAPIHKNMNVDTLGCIDEHGMVAVPDGPGFGMEYDWDYIRKNSTGKIEVIG